MDAEKEISEEAVNAAWAQFQRMPSSNPSDYAHAVVHAVMPLVRKAQAEAAAKALRDFRARLINDQFSAYGIVLPDINEIVDDLDEEARRIEQNSEGNET